MKNKLPIFIIIAGFILKIIYVLQLDNNALLGVDSHDYDTIAMTLLTEHRYMSSTSTFSYFRPPLYPIFLFLIYLFSPQNYLLVGVIQSILITVSAFILFKMARQFFSQKVALIAVAIFSFHPYFIYTSATILTESLFFFLTILSLYLLIRPFQSDSKFILLFLSGIISGMAILTRSTFVIFLPVCIIWFFMLKKSFKFVLKSSIILIFSCFLSLSPWIMRNFILFKEFNFSTDLGGYMFYMGNSKENYERLTTKDYNRFQYLNGRGLPIDKMRVQREEFEKRYNNYASLSPKAKEILWYKAAFIYINNNRAEWLKLFFLKIWEYLKPYLNPMCYAKKYVWGSFFINSIIYLLGIGGLFLAIRDIKLRKMTFFFILFFLSSILIHALSLAGSRYRIIYIDAYLYIFAAYAFIELIKKLDISILLFKNKKRQPVEISEK